MKKLLLLPFVVALPVYAGTSAKEVVAPAAAPEPCLYTWFAGGSVGYLTEFEEAMYNVHVGTDTCWKVGGWNVALFGEVGYTEKDDSNSGRYVPPTNESEFTIAPPGVDESYYKMDNFDGSLGDLEDYLSDLAGNSVSNTGYDLNIIPITFNVKLERPLTGNLNAYFGAGLGVARVDLDVDGGDFGDFSDDDWVFTGQVFAGLNYNFNPNFEVYGGARWMYFDDAELSDSGVSGDLELDDDFLFEIGARFNF